MVIDRLQAFLGIPYKTDNQIEIFSPTIKEVGAIGYIDYIVNLHLSTFNKEKILVDLFNISPEKYITVQHEDDYEVLTDNLQIRDHISNALSFFTKKRVVYSLDESSFMVDDVCLISKNNYRKISLAIKELNGLIEESPEKEKKLTISKKAKQMMERMMLFDQKKNDQEDHIELKDVLSILCSASGNGINVFNANNLTVYQAYEQFERVNLKENFNRLLPVWANGHLNEQEKLPEWIKRTKL